MLPDRQALAFYATLAASGIWFLVGIVAWLALERIDLRTFVAIEAPLATLWLNVAGVGGLPSDRR